MTQVQWLKDGRLMRLMEDVIYLDRNLKEWKAPKGAVVDGASIPRFFWRIIGSPFVGKYRRASAIHDYYCATKTEPHKEVHQMFYECMLSDGVGKTKAKMMYWAVRCCGPRWN